jgi:hypothetical protein
MISPLTPEGNIAVLAVRPAARGNLRGFVDIRIGELTIKDLRIIQQPGQRAWVSPPQKEWVKPDGTRGYVPLVEFSPVLKAMIESMVLDAWRREVKVYE